MGNNSVEPGKLGFVISFPMTVSWVNELLEATIVSESPYPLSEKLIPDVGDYSTLYRLPVNDKL